MLKKFIIAISVFPFLSGNAMAYSPFLDQIVEIYNVRANCQICHIGKQLNEYGRDFKKQFEITPEIITAIKAIEKIDSDKDGFLNADEIKAMSLPGDKISTPDSVKKLTLKKSH